MCDDLCFVTFSYGVSGQVWYLVVSIPDICLLLMLVMSDVSINKQKSLRRDCIYNIEDNETD